MKKVLALWLVAALLLGSLTACKPSTEAPKTDDGSSNATSSSTKDTFTSSTEDVNTDGASSSDEQTDASSSNEQSSSSSSSISGSEDITTSVSTADSTTKTTTTVGQSSSTKKRTTTTKKITTSKPSTAATFKPPAASSSSTVKNKTTTKKTTTTAKPVSTKLTPLAESKYYGRTLLKKESKSLYQAYERIDTAVKQLDSKVDLSDLSITVADAERVLQYYEDDYPQHYFLDSSNVSYAHQGGKITVLYLEYSMSKSQIASTDKQIEKVVKKMLKGVYDSVEEEEREHILYTRLIQHMTYVTGSEDWRYTMYGAFIKGEGVCDAYSKAFQYLMYRAGIPCIRAFGYSHNQNHAWNMVQLHGEWYHVDATWDDPIMDGVNDFVGHTYLNVTTAKLSNHHTITGLKGDGGQVISYPLPNATSTKYHFYHRADTLFDSYDHKKVLKLCEYALDHDTWWVGFHVSCSFQEFLQGFAADYHRLHDELNQDGYTHALELELIEYNDDAQHKLVYIHIT